MLKIKPGLLRFSLTSLKNRDIIEAEKVIKKKINAFRIPIFMMRENGLTFLCSKTITNERKRKVIVANIRKSLISL